MPAKKESYILTQKRKRDFAAAEKNLLADIAKNEFDRNFGANFIDKYCTHFCQFISEEYGIDLPAYLPEAMRHLLENIDENAQKKGAIVRGRYFEKTQAKKRWKNSCYHFISFFGNKYPLFKSKKELNSLDALVEIENPFFARVTTGFDELAGERRKKVFKIKPKEGIFTYNVLRQHIFKKCAGVQIKKRRLGSWNGICLPGDKDGKTLHISNHTRGNYFIFLFDKGEHHIFNLFGDEAEYNLPKDTFSKTNIKRRNAYLAKKAAVFDKGKFIADARSYFIEEWKEHHTEWGNERMVIIEGDVYRNVKKRGSISFRLENGKTMIYVSIDLAGKDIKASFKGPVVLFYEGDKLVNSYEAEHPVGFECRKMRPISESMEYLRIKNVNFKQPAIFFETNQKGFNIPIGLIKTTASEDLEHKTCALLGHVKKDTSLSDFEVLVLDEKRKLKIVPLYKSDVSPAAS